MKILFDHGVPKPIAVVSLAMQSHMPRRIGWHEMGHGDLIRKAGEAGYEVFLSTDQKYPKGPWQKYRQAECLSHQLCRVPIIRGGTSGFACRW
jgi:hypothetical protein